jgi:multidrug efflux pump subunit AcrA (membrane-fusion protein)
MVKELPDPRALSQQAKDRITLNFQQAESKWKQAQADHIKIKAGTWKPDLEIAQLEVQQAKASLNRIQADIERTIVKSPIDGTILQIRIHEGESPSMDATQSPLLIVGNIDAYFVRVSINQLDIDEFNPKNPAVGFLQGDSRVSFPLEFVRIEPYLTGKQNLNNDISERVDTRVMHIVYCIKKVSVPIYVGQQMDVFIETTPSSK